ncbi:MAG: hypothetical protein AB7O24_30430 [Kofleriaceae bacterium]
MQPFTTRGDRVHHLLAVRQDDDARVAAMMARGNDLAQITAHHAGQHHHITE